MSQQPQDRLSRTLLFAPLVFVAHVLEESPGFVPSVLLYLPYCGWVAWQLVRYRRVAPGLLAAAAVLGAIPMAVHGYRILFLGTRLF